MIAMSIMMATYLLYKAHQKINKKFMTQDQKNKMKSIKKSLETIYKAVEKHVETNDLKILALPDYGLILGTTQLLMEEEIIKDTFIDSKKVAVKPKQERKVEEDFIAPEFMNKKTTTFH